MSQRNNDPVKVNTALFTELQTRLASVRFKQLSDFENLHGGFHPNNLKAGLMALPDSAEQVASLLSCCNELGISVVTQGGRTGLAGAASTRPDQLILDTARLDHIIKLDQIGGNVTVECGVTLAALEAEVNLQGLTCGIDLAARGTATIGGMIATNAGGIEAFRNGVMRHRVLGLEAVLADGRVVGDLKRVSKANEGYDIKQLFIGAEGTLGVVTKAVLSLLPMQSGAVTAMVSCIDTGQAVALFRQLHNHSNVNLLSAEVMWPGYAWTVATATGLESTLAFDETKTALVVLLEVELRSDEDQPIFEEELMGLIESEKILSAVVAKNRKERDAMWRIREDSFVVDDIHPHGLWFDVSVPLDNMSVYASQTFERISAISQDLNLFLFAHLGDGNFHATVSTGYPAPELEQAICKAMYDGLEKMGGSFSAEHGIGVEKLQSLKKYVPENNVDVMRQIKQLLDPNGIMNPGKVL